MGSPFLSHSRRTNARQSILPMWELLWLVVLGPAVLLPGRLFPGSWHWLVVMLLFAFWPLYLLDNLPQFPARTLLRTWLTWPIVLLLLCIPLTVWVSVDKTATWAALGYLLYGVAICAALVDLPALYYRPVILAWIVVTVGVCLAGFGIVIQLAQPESFFILAQLHDLFQPLVARLGETINSNVLAGGLVVTLPVALAIFLYYVDQQRELPAIVAIVAFFIILGVVLITKSRGGYLASTIAVAIVFVAYWPRLLYALPIAIGAVAFVLYRLGPKQMLDTLLAGGTLEGLGGRIEIWSRSLYALEDFTFTGIGFGLFDQIIPHIYPFYGTEDPDIPHAHNLLLQVGVDLGLPGLIAMLSLWFYLLLMLFVTWKASRRYAFHPSIQRQRALAAGLLGSMVAMHTHGLLDAPTWGTKLTFIPWLIYACTIILHIQASNSRIMGYSDNGQSKATPLSAAYS